MKKYFFQKIKIGLPFFAICVIIVSTGVWRSLVARSAGGREVAGSNPVTPIYFLSRVFDDFTHQKLLFF